MPTERWYEIFVDEHDSIRCQRHVRSDSGTESCVESWGFPASVSRPGYSIRVLDASTPSEWV